MFPVLLDVRQPLRDQDYVDIAVADHLVGDAQVTSFGKTRLWERRHL
jgi:hypothetical protein